MTNDENTPPIAAEADNIRRRTQFCSCPQCGSLQTKTAATPRWAECADCGHTWSLLAQIERLINDFLPPDA